MTTIFDVEAPSKPMKPPPEKMHYLATRLIMCEAGASTAATTENQNAAAVVQKLRPQLVDLMGNTGFHALVTRSLALTKQETSGLAEARLNPDGTLEGFDVPPDPAQPGSSGGAALLSRMLGLLASFIGETLTVQLVIEVWPNVSLNGYFSQGIDHATHP